jgi:hypothetical protein
MKSDSHRDESKLTHPVSEHADGQSANISHGDGLRHHVRPSTERAFNRAEQPIPVTPPRDRAGR